jgi:hypothetical protein
MPESIQKGPYFTNLDSTLNNPDTRGPARAALTAWLAINKQASRDAQREKLAQLAVKHGILNDQPGMTPEQARAHVRQEWLGNNPLWWPEANAPDKGVNDVATIIVNALLNAMDLSGQFSKPLDCLWSCHDTAEPKVDVAIVAGDQQITVIFHTPRPRDGASNQRAGATQPVVVVGLPQDPADGLVREVNMAIVK